VVASLLDQGGAPQLGREEMADLRALAARPEFRRFVSRLLLSVDILGATYRPDERCSAYAAGRRDMGVDILAAVRAAAPERVSQIFAEPTFHRSNRDRSDDARDTDDDDDDDE
jgi:hypothetical protein